MKQSLSKVELALKDLKANKAFKTYRQISSPQGAYLIVDGKKVLNLCSNNYLGLASHEKIKQASIKAINRYGVGTGAVRALSGNSILHEKLEKQLAKFKKAEAVMITQSGFVANLIAIQTLIDKEDIVISDELNHASIIDAVRLSQAETKFIYAHNDPKSLEEMLKKATEIRQKQLRSDNTPKTILIVTDGVFSMDGDLAPLPQIVALAKKYHAVTMVDDAHGEGVVGKGGRGIVDHFNLHGQIDIEVGTLSKAFGVIGGCIAGSQDLISFYKQKARPFAFSTGLSIPDTGALIECVRELQKSPSLVNKLNKNAAYLKSKLASKGFDLGKSETPIIPLMVGDEQKAKEFSQKLFQKGVFATPIVFPMVAKGKARLRLMPSASHTKNDLDFGFKTIVKVAKSLDLV